MKELQELFINRIVIEDNLLSIDNLDKQKRYNQDQTEDIFSDKWLEADSYNDIDKLYKFQHSWFLDLYGFSDEDAFKDYLANKNVIVDTGCGLGYKAAWFAKLAPHAIVIGIDISESISAAVRNYKNLPNLFFLRNDIADTGLKPGICDFTVCDQVIMHTENPENTFKHLSAITAHDGEFACYVYSKKALPRELLDTYFRQATHEISKEDMWALSTQLTELGKVLSELDIKFNSPDIPLLGIKGGEYDLQRFIYWNFLKCFWKEDWGFDLSRSTNFDWYAPSNAKRYSKEEFLEMAKSSEMEPVTFHSEEACYSGRFRKIK